MVAFLQKFFFLTRKRHSQLMPEGLCAVEEAAELHGLDGSLGHWYHALQEAIEHCTDTDEDLSP